MMTGNGNSAHGQWQGPSEKCPSEVKTSPPSAPNPPQRSLAAHPKITPMPNQSTNATSSISSLSTSSSQPHEPTMTPSSHSARNSSSNANTTIPKRKKLDPVPQEQRNFYYRNAHEMRPHSSHNANYRGRGAHRGTAFHHSRQNAPQQRNSGPHYSHQRQRNRGYSPVASNRGWGNAIRRPNSYLKDKCLCLAYNSTQGCQHSQGIEAFSTKNFRAQKKYAAKTVQSTTCPHIHCNYSDLCRHYYSEGGCTRGDECRFVHATLKLAHVYQCWKLHARSHHHYMVKNSSLQLPEAPTQLHIWDFDDTLFHTMKREHAQRVWRQKYPHKLWPEELSRGWWGHAGSLAAPFDEVPEGPAFALCHHELTHIAPHAPLLSVLMTGRHIDLKRPVMNILDKNGLPWKMFSSLCFKPNDWALGTIHYKCGALVEFLGHYPSLRELEIWEDRIGHVRSFYEFLESELRRRGVALRVHYVVPVYGRTAWEFATRRDALYCDCVVVASNGVQDRRLSAHQQIEEALSDDDVMELAGRDE